MSAVTMLGNPAEMYNYGTQFFMIGIAYIVATPVTTYLFMPVYYRLQLTSAYEVYIFTIPHHSKYFLHIFNFLVFGDEVQQSGAITGLHHLHLAHGK